MIGVYRITNRITKDFYIGKSNNIQHRIYNHRYKGIHGKRFEDDIQKYGWKNFDVEVLEECSLDELHEREAYYIDNLKPTYNEVIRGRKLSAETKAKISKALTGKKQSLDTRQKRIESIKKRHLTIPQTNENHKKRVCVGGRIFESVKSAAEYLGADSGYLTNVLKGKRGNGTYKGVKVWYVV